MMGTPEYMSPVAQIKNYATNQTFRDKMKGYTDLWATGSREILQIA
jgi:hypothetical protein